MNFDYLIHADWSCQTNKRWIATAKRAGAGWIIGGAKPAGPPEQLLETLLSGRKILAGFDFPLGLPIQYGKQTGLKGFREALFTFGSNSWVDFYSVARAVDQISLRRPFYPHRSQKGQTFADLRGALQCEHGDELLRECEKATEERGSACCVFWTLGAKQVGKAALHGWRHLICPALRNGAFLWPFDGPLNAGALTSNLVLCETYPREAYGHVNVVLPVGASKRIQSHRHAALQNGVWRKQTHIQFTETATAHQLDDAFGSSPRGEDAFDAMVGLLSMVEIVAGRRPEGKPPSLVDQDWEGWILGQSAKAFPHK